MREQGQGPWGASDILLKLVFGSSGYMERSFRHIGLAVRIGYEPTPCAGEQHEVQEAEAERQALVAAVCVRSSGAGQESLCSENRETCNYSAPSLPTSLMTLPGGIASFLRLLPPLAFSSDKVFRTPLFDALPLTTYRSLPSFPSASLLEIERQPRT